VFSQEKKKKVLMLLETHFLLKCTYFQELRIP